MNQFLHGMARAAVESFSLPDPVVEIGAYQVPGQEKVTDLRALFPRHSYLGVDIRSGPGVDMTASVEELPFETSSVGTILAMNTLEHVAHFWRGVAEIRRVLRPDGAVLISCPFYFHIHRHPSDYWRFTPEALDVLLEGYPRKIIGWQGNAKKPLHVWALAFGQDNTVEASQMARFRSLLRRCAREPMPWSRRLRYQLGRLLCGRRPFVPYLDQDQWEFQCHPAFLMAPAPESLPRSKVARLAETL